MKAAVSRNVLPQPDPTPNIEPEFDARFVRLKTSLRARIIFVGAFLLLGLGLRLEGIRTAAPHPDEHHWVERSALFAEHIAAGSYEHSTTHLGHPGITASIFMAIGQRAARQWNHFFGAAEMSRLYIDELSASRIATALVSSLVLLVLLFSSTRLLGLTTVLLGTMFLTLDPQHIALSRLAHIDGALTLFSTLALLLGLAAERDRRPAMKVLAGALWGLAIATKPTALAIVAILLLYKFIRRGIVGRYSAEPLPLLEWSDIWAVVAGHVVLASLYTKLWILNNTYITKHHILPPLSDAIIFFCGAMLAMPALPWAIAAATALCVLLLVREKPKGLRYHLTMAFVLTGFLSLAVWAFPVATSNLVRFWYWVGGLSERTHKAYGMTWAPPTGGYPEIWARRVGSVVLLGWLTALPLIAHKWRRIASRDDAERVAFLLLLVFAPLIWTIPLAVSTKQTIRYLVPIFPAVVFVSAWGVVEMWKLIARSRLLGRVELRTRRYVPYVLAVLLMGVQFFIARTWSPNYALYFNSLTGGPPAAMARGFTLGPVSYEGALERILQEALASNKRQNVEVLGDVDLMKYAFSRTHGAQENKLIDFREFRDGVGSHWVLEFTNFTARKGGRFDHERYELLEELKEHGGVVYRLYRVHPSTFETPFELPIRHGTRQMGAMREFAPGEQNVIASRKFARAGYIHFNQYVRTTPGKYRVRFTAAKAPEAVSSERPAADAPIIRVELSSRCTRNVFLGDIDSFTLQPIDLECRFDSDSRSQLSIYWFGNYPVRAGDITIQRIQ